ncbi:MAG: hypothetical protein AAF628_06055 [Planctomycetota bacterium]
MIGSREGDRAVERALDEILHRGPPDVSFRVLQELRLACGPQKIVRGTAWRPPRGGFWLGFWVAVAGLAMGWLALGRAPRPAAPALEVRVARGALTWGRVAMTAPVGADQGVWIVPRRGDRVATPGRAALELAGFGRLALAAGTIMEVERMNYRDLGIGIGVGSITFAVVAGAVSYGAGSGGAAPATAQAGETLEVVRQRPAGAISAELAALERDLAEAHETIQGLQAREPRQAVASEAMPRSEPLADAALAAAAAAPGESESALIEVAPEFAAALGGVDFRALGEHTVALQEALLLHAEHLARGEEIPLSLEGRIRALNGQMAVAIGDVDFDAIPGSSGAAKLLHPASAVNVLKTMLDVSERPLDEAQRRELRDVGLRFSAEDTRRRQSYGDDVAAIVRYQDELALRERFIAATDALLTSDQQAALRAGAHADRTDSQIWSAASSWRKWARVAAAPDRQALGRQVTEQLGSSLGLDEQGQFALSGAVRRWAEAYPDAWWDKPMSGFDRNNRYETARVRDAVQRQIELVRDIVRTVPMDVASRRRLLGLREFVLPFQG